MWKGGSVSLRKLVAPVLVLALVAGCKRSGEIAAGGITAVRTACPTVAIPAGTGDVTLFNPADSRDASAIDVVATIANVTSTCTESDDQVVTNVQFDVQARRASAEGARTVTLPYFVTVVRGGSSVVAKRIENVTLTFAPGQLRASTVGQGSSSIARSAATLPEDVRRRLTERRQAGDADAAIDPLTDPNIRQTVLSATFETLVGFQLTEDQLRYNATR